MREQGLPVSGPVARLLTPNNVSTATNFQDGARMLISLPFSGEITPTSNFDLKFTLTGSVSVDLAYSAGLVHAVKNGADPFQVVLTITN